MSGITRLICDHGKLTLKTFIKRMFSDCLANNCPRLPECTRTLAGSVLPFFLCFQSIAAAQLPSESEVKAVYLYNFTKFVTWPDHAFASPNAPLTLCIFGEPLAREILVSLREKTTNGHPFQIIFPTEFTNIAHCHMVFFSQISATLANRILESSPNTPTLTVSDHAGFARNTGTMEFVLDRHNRMRIVVNLSNAKRRKLAISAKLLETALNVIP